mmetsp:Transcript_7916/g.29541  ORF Transcript_7916/g.29541 Transcript_7916/m.29541 type:complete len:91 (-) Transcript_7916:1340-1612(-)
MPIMQITEDNSSSVTTSPMLHRVKRGIFCGSDQFVPMVHSRPRENVQLANDQLTPPNSQHISVENTESKAVKRIFDARTQQMSYVVGGCK